MHVQHDNPRRQNAYALIALTAAIVMAAVAVATFTSHALSRDDCVKVTTDLGAGRSRSVETCS